MSGPRFAYTRPPQRPAEELIAEAIDSLLRAGARALGPQEQAQLEKSAQEFLSRLRRTPPR